MPLPNRQQLPGCSGCMPTRTARLIGNHIDCYGAESGATMAQAKIALTNTDENTSEKPNGDGQYQINNLQPGHYTECEYRQEGLLLRMLPISRWWRGRWCSGM